MLGICLGMQLLGRRSEESNGVDLLGIIDEDVEEAGLRWAQHYEFLSHQMAQQLGGPTEVRVEVNKSSPVVWLKTWLSPNIWVRVPLTEIHQEINLIIYTRLPGIIDSP